MTYFIYKLTVGGEPYFGFTSRPPHIRLEEHIKTALEGKWKHRSKLYPLLNEYEGDYDDFEILYEGDNEQQALLLEIAAIRAAGKENTLNLSDGGEGATMTVKTREVDGRLQVMTVLKKSAKEITRKPRRRRRRKNRRR